MNTHAPVPLDRRAAPVMGLLSLRVYCPEVDLVSLGAFLRLRDVPSLPCLPLKLRRKAPGSPPTTTATTTTSTTSPPLITAAVTTILSPSRCPTAQSPYPIPPQGTGTFPKLTPSVIISMLTSQR